MMKLKAIISFNDLEAKEHRNIGDVFKASEERAKFLLEHKAVEVVEEEKPIVEEQSKKEIKTSEISTKKFKKNKKK